MTSNATDYALSINRTILELKYGKRVVWGWGVRYQSNYIRIEIETVPLIRIFRNEYQSNYIRIEIFVCNNIMFYIIGINRTILELKYTVPSTTNSSPSVSIELY